MIWIRRDKRSEEKRIELEKVIKEEEEYTCAEILEKLQLITKKYKQAIEEQLEHY